MFITTQPRPSERGTESRERENERVRPMLLSGLYVVFPRGIFRFGLDESNDCNYHCAATAITTNTLQLNALRAKEQDDAPPYLCNSRWIFNF